jgi:DNA replication initiation complex subunit (GINS family)
VKDSENLNNNHYKSLIGFLHMNYEELYESLRKEKNSEQLQALPLEFIESLTNYLAESRSHLERNGGFFADDLINEKKQYENSIVMFKELMLRRKKKILNLVFIAAETGVMKKDFIDMLSFEQDLFEKLIKSVEELDKKISNVLNPNVSKESIEGSEFKVIFKEDVKEFIDMSGKFIGPFKKGDEVSLKKSVAEILINEKKCGFV